MPELTPRELLQPSLLDRLADDEPDRKEESRDRRVLSMRQLRESVLRDLRWLLNTVALEVTDDLTDFPNVSASVVNYGIMDLTGVTASSLKAADLERRLREAILRFEPRLIAESLEVKVSVDPSRMSSDSVFFDIRAELWANPLPESLYIRTTLDLECGAFAVSESPGGG